MSLFVPLRLFRRALVIGAISVPALYGQMQTPLTEGIRSNTPRVHAFTNARIVQGPGRTIESGTIVIRDGLIAAVGAQSTPIPKDARIWDLKGLTVYPGLIDAYTSYGMPNPTRAEAKLTGRGGAGDRGPGNWNDKVLAERSASTIFAPDVKAAEKLRSQGLTSVLSVPVGGIFKGSSALISLGNGKPNELIMRTDVAQHITLEGDSLHEGYPESLMGFIALIRQTFLDAGWYQKARSAYKENPALERPELNESLEALKGAVAGTTTVVIETPDEQNFLRAQQIANEFSLNLVIRGSGREYMRLDPLSATHRPVIFPVNFPDPPSVQTPEEALQIPLTDLRYWDEAPENPSRLAKAGMECSFTSVGLKDPATFLARVRKAVRRGLSPDAALASLTTAPSRLFKVERLLGTLDAGKRADLVITDGDLFAEKTAIKEVWVDGKRYEVKGRPDADPRGTWAVTFAQGTGRESITLLINGELDALQGTVKTGKTVKLSSVQFSSTGLGLTYPGDSIGTPGIIRLSATVGASVLDGRGESPDGTQFLWTGRRTAPFVPPPDTVKPVALEMASFPPVFPPVTFGRTKVPEQASVVMVRGATIWTSGPQGKIENGDVIFREGKVLKIGKGLDTPAGAMMIDGKGKHVTPGIIDCHSHMGVTGAVNEGTRASSAMVRIGDVIDGNDIDIYRGLAGGLTEVHALHGSANPIGGQCQLIKLRWGMLPEELKFAGVPPTIKFALGENVKQSNWGERFTTRYPQTRMGVEQFYRDEFRAALDYEKKMQRSSKSGLPVRRDLELETVLEILHGKRLVHCHSYRQDEILMMMRVAEDFGFRIRAFQHILEGYKVADLMAKHGAGGSTFSDWWAYKLEVYDAIPYNGPIMHDEGVLVSFNSDSDELARRLNLEAAKAVKYGGLSEEEALKFVTINPAKQLEVDTKVGSLEPGKDADFVIWNGNPLSPYSLCEQTWIEGRRFFDRQEDRQMYDEAQKQRAVLIQKILSGPKPTPVTLPGVTPKMHDGEVQP